MNALSCHIILRKGQISEYYLHQAKDARTTASNKKCLKFFDIAVKKSTLFEPAVAVNHFTITGILPQAR